MTNLIDFDIKLRSLGTYDRRAWSEIASGIGDWSKVMELIGFLAIPLNVAVLYFARVPPAADDTSEFGNAATITQWLLLKDYTIQDAILFIVMIEHILIIFKTLIQGVIPDVPKQVHQTEAQREIQTAQAQAALQEILTATDQLATDRAATGSTLTELESAQARLVTQTEASTATFSRISDTDVNEVMTQLAREQSLTPNNLFALQQLNSNQSHLIDLLG